LGQWITSKTLGILGMSDVLLPVGDRDIFAVSETTIRDRLGNDISGQWYFTVTPARVGNFLAQIEIFGGVARGLQVNTYTVNVVP
jgi:hypothetical protein